MHTASPAVKTTHLNYLDKENSRLSSYNRQLQLMVLMRLNHSIIGIRAELLGA